ncbi:MAG: nitrate/nitrite transporter [Nitrospinota bacterium]
MTGPGVGPGPRSAPRFHYGYVILFFCLLSLAGSLGIGRFAYTLILPAMRDGLGLQNTEMGLLGTIGFIGYLAAAIPGGALAARFGPRLIISLALLVCGSGLALLGLTHDLRWSALLMAWVGIGSAVGNASAFGFASAWFAGRSRGIATGVTLGGPGVGMVAVGAGVPFILARYGAGWRWAWFYCGIVTALLGLLVWVFVRNRPDEMGLEAVGGPPGEAPGRTQSSLSWGKVYREKEVWRLSLMMMLFAFAYIIYGTFFAAYVQDTVGLSQEQTGRLWSSVGVLAIFSGLVGGFLADRLGRAWALTWLFMGLAAALLLVAFSSTPAALYLSIPLYGLTLWGFPTVMGAGCADLLGPKLAPAGVGLATFIFGVGQAAGPVFAGALYDATGNFSAAFLCGVAAALLGVILAWVPLGTRGGRGADGGERSP